MSFKIKFFLLFLTSFYLLIKPVNLFAEECDLSKCNSSDSSCIQTVQTACEQKLTELGQAKDTLSNQISFLDSQYQLALLKITQTENSIRALEKEIASLSVEIGKLEGKINNLSAIYINQIIQTYKLQKKYPSFAYLLSDNLNSFLTQHQYMTSIQSNSKQTLINMETIRYNYDQQKILKEEKQTELEQLQKTLASQKSSLATQKTTKNNLLEITKNNEQKYQQILDDARAQLSAFGSFTSGGSLLSNQTHYEDNWGYYFNQRDSEWGSIVFGWDYNSNGNKIYYDMKGYGCLITSTTMILTKYGKSIRPSDLARNSSLFDGHTGNMRFGTLSTNGVSFTRNTIACTSNISSADSELEAGRPVIAGVGGSCKYPSHFIVIKYKKDGQYYINDPYLEFSDFNKTFSSTGYRLVRIDSLRVN
jgi:peptidoglycan hydrolase CwlO-like protein